MSDIQRVQVLNLIEDLRKAKRCPNPGCADVGWYPEQIDEDEWEQIQCEFCEISPDSFFKIASKFSEKKS